MILIEKNNEVKAIDILVTPGWKDDPNMSRSLSLELPAVFLRGNKYTIQHRCLKCRETLQTGFGFGSFKYLGSLSHLTIKTKELIDAIAKIFDLRLVSHVDSNNFEVYYYQLARGNVAEAFFYKCDKCEVKCLGVFVSLPGDDDRSPEPDKGHIEKTVSVNFDESDFFKVYTEAIKRD